MRFLKKSLITRLPAGGQGLWNDYTDKEIGVIFLGISEIMCKIDLTKKTI